MSEIKFRAWDKDTKEMVMVHQLLWDRTIFHRLTHISGGAALHNQGYYELMQYTGLKDKNGKEIYEGDILVDSYGECAYRPVEWSGNGFWLVEPSGSRHMPEQRYREVVGNIYENPELLEEPK